MGVPQGDDKFQARKREANQLAKITDERNCEILQFQARKREANHLALDSGDIPGQCVLVSSPQAGGQPFSRCNLSPSVRKDWLFQARKREANHLACQGYDVEVMVLPVSSPQAGGQPFSQCNGLLRS